MESILSNRFMARMINRTKKSREGDNSKKAKVLENNVKNLTQGRINTEYIIKDINTDDEELKNFLFTLGCYKGERVTVISALAENYIINIKDARYSIDIELAKAIII